MQEKRISTQLPYPSQFIEVNGSKMHYIEAGDGDPILFLHGIPTSCYLWRNIIPHLSTLGRCIAPDLIGLGRSDKPNIEYTILDHIQYIETFIATLNLKNITLVMHGWGSVIGLHYAMHHENNCKGLVFYESFLRSADVSDLSLPFQEQIQSLEDLEKSAEATINGVTFIDRIIPQNVMRQLTDDEMTNYRQPFSTVGAEKPILQYLKELPKGLQSSAADKIIATYSEKLVHSQLPKLLLYSVPGFITTIATVMWAKDHLSHLQIVDIGEEMHLAQESCPQLIGETISVWLQSIDQTRS